VEENTPLGREISAGRLHLPGEDMDRDMYERCRQTLMQNGFEQYEISNFARPGRRCRHNENCWRYQPYLGFGSAAHGFFKGERRANTPSLDAYLAGAAPETEKISRDDAMFEFMMLGLRLTEGVREADFENTFGASLQQTYGERLKPALLDGRLCRREGRVYLSEHGMDVMNSVLVALL